MGGRGGVCESTCGGRGHVWGQGGAGVMMEGKGGRYKGTCL